MRAQRQPLIQRHRQALVLLESVTRDLEAASDRLDEPVPYDARVARRYLDQHADELDALSGGDRRVA